MFHHIALIVSLTAVALAAGVAMVPGEREQWTMLVRDGRNQEALKTLEARYRAGKRDVDAVLHLYKLYMSFAEIARATNVMEDFAANHPADPATIAMLAKHYDDIQDKPAQIRALEELFHVAPSPQIARDLLAQYRLDAAFDREQQLLRTLLADQMITANDAERLGLLLAAKGDLYGAREALIRFDEIANHERSIGRLALFDVLVQIGDKTAALNKAGSWLGYWRKGKVSVHRGAGLDIPSARLMRMMMAVDERAARRLFCEAHRNETPARAGDDSAQEPCGESAPAVTAAFYIWHSRVIIDEPRGEFGRKRRK